MENLDLFEVPADAPKYSDLEQYFDDWCASHAVGERPLLPTSVAVYRAMWAPFARFCMEQPTPTWPEEVTPALFQLHLERRRKDASLSPRYGWRLLRLVDRVILARPAHLRRTAAINEVGSTAPSMACRSNEILRSANERTRDHLPPYLDSAVARQLVDYLLSAVPGTRACLPGMSWRRVRDYTAVAMQLGAGLTPGEVRALLVANITVDAAHRPEGPWRVLVPGHDKIKDRQVPVSRWARGILKRWIDVRGRIDIPGTILFPATSKGGPWSKEGLYNASLKLMRDAGLATNAHRPFQLRHTFAFRQLKAGKQEDEVAIWLGLKQSDRLERYIGLMNVDPDVA